MSEKTYIIGHKNPDADAICSAIGYAAYKSAKGEGQPVPARCGNSNARIETILSRFDVPLPEFIGDITPRVQDIMVRDFKHVHPDSTCMEALDIIDRHDLRILPVVDNAGVLHGSISIFDLGEHFIPKPKDERSMRQVHTSMANIVRALKAETLNLVEPDRVEDLYVRIGAMDIRSFGKYYENEDLAHQSIIIVGDRYDIQQRSIQSGVRLLVVSGNLPVEEDVLELAKERGVSIVISPHDSATTSWIIRSAGRIDRMVKRKTVNFGPEEKLTTIRRKIASSDAAAFMVVDEQNNLLGLFTKTDLIKPIQTKLILVDHNELSQAVPGAEQVQILEIVDHHRLGNPPTQQPIAFINLPVGSTSTIVAELFQKDRLTLDPSIAGILMGGIISDTLNLKGPTTTQTDVQILGWLESIAGESADELADEIFSAGSLIKSEEPENVVRSDFKIYHEGNFRFSVSQVEELGFDNLWEHRKTLDDALEFVRTKENLFFSAMLVTNINTQNSLLLIRGDEGIIDSITYPHHATDDIFELKGIVSRKKQLIPYLTGIVRQFNT
jgi:manganese-dependent inorganic pyrophosphatase